MNCNIVWHSVTVQSQGWLAIEDLFCKALLHEVNIKSNAFGNIGEESFYVTV